MIRRIVLCFLLYAGPVVADPGPLHLGGYLSLRGEAPRGAPAHLDLHDLSLFTGWDPGGRWRLFGEFELGSGLVWEEGRGGTTKEAEFDLERLYGEYDLRPEMKLRLGKFLTPVGRWNLIHADPLVWTTRRPLTTELPFAAHAAGVSLNGQGVWGERIIEYQLFVDDSQALDPDRTDLTLGTGTLPDGFDRALGARVRLLSGDRRNGLGLSLAHFRLAREPSTRTLVGLDWCWRHRGLEWDSETFYRQRIGQIDWGGFLQGVGRIRGGLHWVGRYEYVHSDTLSGDSAVGLLGLTWRLGHKGVFKLAWQRSSGLDLQPGGWTFSYGLLY